MTTPPPAEPLNPSLQRQTDDLKSMKLKKNTNARLIPEMSKIKPPTDAVMREPETQTMTDSEINPPTQSPSSQVDYVATSQAIIDAVRYAGKNLEFTPAQMKELCTTINCPSPECRAQYPWFSMLISLVIVAVLGYIVGKMRSRVL